MSNTLSPKSFELISSLILNRIGLYFSLENKHDLERGIKTASMEYGTSNFEEFAENIVNITPTQELINLLGRHLTIGETYFFRETRVFEILEKDILRKLIEDRRQNSRTLKIWSAGCSTGEEPYSIAILLDKMIPDINNWDIKIIATDINQNYLSKAIEGIYSEWSFRGIDVGIKNNYFTKLGHNKYQIRNDIRSMVDFGYLNLAQDNYHSQLNKMNGMDIIFCRNVLMYFDNDGREKVVHKFYDTLNDLGYLVLGLTELSHFADSDFKSIQFEGAVLFKKQINHTTLLEKETTAQKPRCTPCINNINKKAKKKFPKSIHSGNTNEVTPQTGITGLKKEKAELSQNEIRSAYISAVNDFENRNYENASLQFAVIIEDSKNFIQFTDEEKEKTYILLSKCLANLGKTQEAKGICQNGLKMFKLSHSLYFILARILQEENKMDGAVKALGKAIYLNPDYVVAHFTLANIYRRLSKFSESQKNYKNTFLMLNKISDDTILEDTEGSTAGEIKEIVKTMMNRSSWT